MTNTFDRFRRRDQKDKSTHFTSEETTNIQTFLHQLLELELRNRFSDAASILEISSDRENNTIEFVTVVDVGADGDIAYVAGGNFSFSSIEMETYPKPETRQKLTQLHEAVRAKLQQEGWRAVAKKFGRYPPEIVRTLPLSNDSTSTNNQRVRVKHLLGWVLGQ